MVQKRCSWLQSNTCLYHDDGLVVRPEQLAAHNDLKWLPKGIAHHMPIPELLCLVQVLKASMTTPPRTAQLLFKELRAISSSWTQKTSESKWFHEAITVNMHRSVVQKFHFIHLEYIDYLGTMGFQTKHILCNQRQSYYCLWSSAYTWVNMSQTLLFFEKLAIMYSK